MGAGRPSSYRPEFAEQAYKLCLLGATDAEMAAFFGVSEQTINAWKQGQPEFLESITRGKSIADANVAERLYQRAMGYSHEAVKIFQYEGKPMVVPYTEHYPPDTQAVSLWLRNRQPAKWRDVQRQELTGANGGPIETAALTPEERQAAARAMLDEAFGPHDARAGAA
jgi:DNA-binding XRE family transcriptional regulator